MGIKTNSGSAYITYKRVQDAERCIKTVDDAMWMGKCDGMMAASPTQQQPYSMMFHHHLVYVVHVLCSCVLSASQRVLWTVYYHHHHPHPHTHRAACACVLWYNQVLQRIPQGVAMQQRRVLIPA